MEELIIALKMLNLDIEYIKNIQYLIVYKNNNLDFLLDILDKNNFAYIDDFKAGCIYITKSHNY